MSTSLTRRTDGASLPKALGLGIAGSVLITLVVLAFLWPAKSSTPQDLPVSIVGQDAAVTAFTDALATQGVGTFEFVRADDRADAVRQIEQRETYGAIVLAAPPAAPEVLTATGASPVATQILTGFAGQLQTQAQAAGAEAPTVTVTDIVPLPDTDPTGTGLAAVAFPLTIGGILAGILISLALTGPVRRLTGLATFAVSAGLLLTVVLDTWFGFLQGNFWITALAVGTAIFATGAFLTGAAALLGRVGLGLAAAFTILVANPLASAATPWQFLPSPWGAFGQWLIPGASNSLLRTISYFPAASAATQWWVLLTWSVVGVALILLGRRTAAD